MIKLSLITSWFLISGYFTEPPVKTSIVFIITETHSYCGGANRSEDPEVKESKKKIPSAETFYIIRGKINTQGRKIIKSFSMGTAGSSCTTLNPGTYSVINKFLYQKLVIDKSHFDEACLKHLWATPLFSFTVANKKVDTIVHNIELPCEYNKPCAKLNNDIPM
ncbi:MAG: hypothetical protein WKF35_10055 [Ferruginibacter sp.]